MKWLETQKRKLFPGSKLKFFCRGDSALDLSDSTVFDPEAQTPREPVESLQVERLAEVSGRR
ncbi:MAG: hypothetical protein AMJ94_13240 [Deltaproteobacteria bacterium SM23_61]|nr:MAG: hypothetical protein AMJ94_13240 [Deltaproteobacteria bacterium SM23_61]